MSATVCARNAVDHPTIGTAIAEPCSASNQMGIFGFDGTTLLSRSRAMVGVFTRITAHSPPRRPPTPDPQPSRPSPRRSGASAWPPMTTSRCRIGRCRWNRRTKSGSSREFEVAIPPGTTDGTRIRLGGQGGPGAAGAPAGDLFLRVRLEPDPRFEVDGADVRTTLDVAPWEAALGASIEVPTLDGTVVLKVPAGTASGQTL